MTDSTGPVEPTGDHTQPEHLARGVMREVLDDGGIVVFTLIDLADETVDVWVEACLELMERCRDEGQPLRVLQDLARPGVVQTAYSRARGNTVTNAFPDLKGRIGYVMQPGITSQRVGRYVQGQEHHYRERRIFYDRDEAIAWLREDLETSAGDTPSER